MADNETTKRTLLEANVQFHEDRIGLLETSIKTLNHEMGDVQRSLGKIEGRVSIITWLMGATALVILAEFVRSLLTL